MASRRPTGAAIPADGAPFLLFSSDQGALAVASKWAKSPVHSGGARPFFTVGGRFVVSIDASSRAPDRPSLSLQPMDGDTLPSVRMPTAVGHVLLETLLATAPRTDAMARWPEEAQLTMTLPSGAFVQVTTEAGTTSAAVSVPVVPPPAASLPQRPSSTDLPIASGHASGAETATDARDRPATIPPPPRTTPLVFSSHPAEGPGAFCLVQGPASRSAEGASRSNIDVPLLAYVSAERVEGVRPTAPWVPVVVEDLTNGSTLATFYSTEVKAIAFSPDCERLYVVGEDGVERSWHVMHRYGGEKPGWVKHLSSLVFGSEIWRDGEGREATRAVPGALGGPTRAALLAEIRAAKDKGDPSAAYVWRHWFGPDAR